MNRTIHIDHPPIAKAARKPGLTALVAGNQGAVTMMFAICASLMIGSMCMALDTIDYERNQARMQMALDVATLSAGADLAHFSSITGNDLVQWQADAQAYFNANFPTGYAGITVPNANFSATVSGTPAAGETINLAASGKMSLVAPLFLTNTSSPSGSGSTQPPGSNDTATVSASNSALRIPQNMLEMVMVLDNTGSMSDSADGNSQDGTKMAGLQLAANGLVQDLFAQDNTNYYVGLVPFASTVNVLGALPSGGTWLNPSFAYNASNVGMSNWGGCTAEPRDASGYLYPQAYSPTDTLKFTPYYYNLPPAGLQVFNSSQCSASKSSTYKNLPLTLGNGMANQCNGYVGSYKGTGVGVSYSGNGGFAGTKLTQNSDCIGQPVTFLTTDQSTLTAAINRMKPLGSTVIPVGLLWGWRMLSSAWSGNASASGWISSDPSLPKPEDTQALQRVMIVLTDGENQIGAAGSIPNDLYFNGLSGVATNSLAAPTVTRADGTSLVDGLTDSSELHSGNPIDQSSGNNAGYPDDVNTFQLAVCTAIKQSGVTIYAITFGSSTGDATSVAQQAMQSCASPGDYYHAPTSATLNTIFQQIASNLGVLRLTK